MPLIEMEEIYRIYQTGDTRVYALNGINFTAEAGEWIAVSGGSGSGKSTLMNLLGCLDTPTMGRYRLDGQDVSRLSDRRLSQIRSHTIGFVFQGFNLISSLTALENVELPLIYKGLSSARRRRLATAALEQVGLSHRLDHRPSEMSGGQQQRVAIARAIAAHPPILLADEPTGNLDTYSGEEIIQLLTRLHQTGVTVILITHDPSLANRAPRNVVIRDGKIIQDRKTPVLRPTFPDHKEFDPLKKGSLI